MVVTLSEGFFNKQITDNLPQGGQVQSAQIDLHPDNLANVTATVQVNSSLRLSPDAAVQMGVQDGRIVIDITKVDVGGLSVPSSLIEPQIAQPERDCRDPGPQYSACQSGKNDRADSNPC